MTELPGFLSDSLSQSLLPFRSAIVRCGSVEHVLALVAAAVVRARAYRNMTPRNKLRLPYSEVS